jgi:hypothetical protein
LKCGEIVGFALRLTTVLKWLRSNILLFGFAGGPDTEGIRMVNGDPKHKRREHRGEGRQGKVGEDGLKRRDNKFHNKDLGSRKRATLRTTVAPHGHSLHLKPRLKETVGL